VIELLVDLAWGLGAFAFLLFVLMLCIAGAARSYDKEVDRIVTRIKEWK